MTVVGSQRLVAGPRIDPAPTPAVRFSRWAGVVYASLGIVGLGLTGLTEFTSPQGEMLWVLEVNGLQNLLHLLVGVALVAASGATPETARVATMLSAVAFAVVGLLGPSVTGTDANVLALNGATNATHLLTAMLATLCAFRSHRSAP